jgi:hypothetical protein
MSQSVFEPVRYELTAQFFAGWTEQQVRDHVDTQDAMAWDRWDDNARYWMARNPEKPYSGGIPPLGIWRLDQSTGNYAVCCAIDPFRLETWQESEIWTMRTVQMMMEWWSSGYVAPPVHVVTDYDSQKPKPAGERDTLLAIAARLANARWLPIWYYPTAADAPRNRWRNLRVVPQFIDRVEAGESWDQIEVNN